MRPSLEGRGRCWGAGAAGLIAACAVAVPAGAQEIRAAGSEVAKGPPSFVVTYDGSITDSYTGRVYVMLSTSTRGEPRYGPSWMDTEPFFAVDVADWQPGEPLRFTDRALGYPGPLSELASNTYFIQAVMRRNLDSPTIGRGPGSAYSAVVRRGLGGGSGGRIDLTIDQVVEPRPFPETDTVKEIELRSKLLSDFHGRDVMLRAAVVLPPGYDDQSDVATAYPALYFIGGFGADHRMARFIERLFTGVPGGDKLCLIVPDPSCRTGHHVFADSANNGPWGRALTEELIPAIEKRFRVIAAPGGRFLTGVSSGGWSSLWLQVTYPDYFAGVWSIAPDPIDFRAFQQVNLYEPGANLYVDEQGNRRPVGRSNGQVMLWYDSFCRMENVLGDGGQIGSFEAVFGPRGADGRPVPMYDRRSGAVNPDVVEYWKQYDIALKLKGNWAKLGPKLAGKLHIFVGAEDNFYLEDAVELTKPWIEQVGSDAVVEIVPDRTHMDIMNPELVARIVREVLGE